ncbi:MULTISPECIES: MliC family protein [unclassified Bradyrhizobium]|uniref:MliC family protein n=1 Tax=unclassified Bradyrhizobium TaxID=2631580 RepID=UPI0024797F1B|nr:MULTISPECIES: MliC family protein [unclassified Bradyrhizobium]WGR68240.1 MliC family protein [Bradyrhizobium sp. ISRA426]WGR80295.1 MliC family protein [Bradyrhizobium sp. ISRA430]WGR83480.1 MliC family protein [Bradyrhizobium sp. ISRA432]
MGRHKAIILAFGLLAGGTFQARPASAQTFQTYRCADGTQFIVGFYDYDKRAFVQIDGEPITLAKRLTVSGARYSGAGITLKFGKTGTTTVKHLKRPVTTCAVI